MGKWSTLLETSLADLVRHFAAWQFLCVNEVGKMMSSCSPIYWDMDEESLLVMARYLEYLWNLYERTTSAEWEEALQIIHL